jgi:hypothetical protein
MMKNNEFFPFDAVIKDQNGVIRNEDKEHMLPEDIMKMNWLAENVVGEIPEIDELKDSAKSIVELKGVNLDTDKDNASNSDANIEAESDFRADKNSANNSEVEKESVKNADDMIEINASDNEDE